MKTRIYSLGSSILFFVFIVCGFAACSNEGTDSKPMENIQQQNLDSKSSKSPSSESSSENTSQTGTPQPQASQDEPSAQGTQSVSDPEVLYRKCASCHGKDGKSIAPGSVGNIQIASLNKERVSELLKGFRAQSISRGGNSIIMYMQAKNLSDEDIEALANYIDAF